LGDRLGGRGGALLIVFVDRRPRGRGYRG
jgi:hypothetical protein